MKTKTIFKLTCLFCIALFAGCTDESPQIEKQDSIAQVAKDYEAKEQVFFAYDANDLTERKDGFVVQTSKDDADFSTVTDYAMKNGDLIYGLRDIELNYHYFAVKHFDNYEDAKKYAEEKGLNCFVNLETGFPYRIGDSWFCDQFNVGDKFSKGRVTIECKPEKYYSVTIDLTGQPDMKQVGKDYGNCIYEIPVLYDIRVSGYLIGSAVIEFISPASVLYRINSLYHKMPKADRDMINGMASGFGGFFGYHAASLMFYTANLLPDVLRPKACSAFGVMPEMSETGKTMVYRTLDWPDISIKYALPYGREGVVSPLQAITKMKYNDRTIYTFGMLGIISGVTSIDATNSNMTAILDASTGDEYSISGKSSYVFDLAQTIRARKTIDEMATDMKTPAYTFNHLLLMANKEKVGILENNINLKGDKPVREMRYWDSALGTSLSKWNYNYMLGSVNCFQLKGQVDNSNAVPELCNKERWKQMQDKVKEILDKKGGSGKLTSDDLWNIQTTHSGTLNPKKFDNLYNHNTLQMIQYIPADNKVRVHLKGFNGKPVDKPGYFELTLTP